MDKPLRVLIVNDSEADALLLIRALRKGGLLVESERVDTAEAMDPALESGWWDAAISVCHMPEFSAEGALTILQASGNDQPFIVVSGAIGEEEAVALLKAGLMISSERTTSPVWSRLSSVTCAKHRGGRSTGGRVWVESSLGKGSSIFLTLPLDAADKRS